MAQWVRRLATIPDDLDLILEIYKVRQRKSPNTHKLSSGLHIYTIPCTHHICILK